MSGWFPPTERGAPEVKAAQAEKLGADVEAFVRGGGAVERLPTRRGTVAQVIRREFRRRGTLSVNLKRRKT